MIKINLLPREERVRRTPINTKLILAGVGAVFALLLMAAGYYWLNGEVDRLQVAVRDTQAEVRRFDDLAKQVDRYRGEKKRLEEKIKIIDTLVAAQAGPVHLLDEVSKVLPKEIWLTALNRTGKKLDISGIAFSNFNVAALMTDLGKSSTLLKNVDLVVSEKTAIEGAPVERFTITAEVVEAKR
jgi:type IV pilus assembly protein PilN